MAVVAPRLHTWAIERVVIAFFEFASVTRAHAMGESATEVVMATPAR